MIIVASELSCVIACKHLDAYTYIFIDILKN